MRYDTLALFHKMTMLCIKSWRLWSPAVVAAAKTFVERRMSLANIVKNGPLCLPPTPPQ